MEFREYRCSICILNRTVEFREYICCIYILNKTEEYLEGTSNYVTLYIYSSVGSLMGFIGIFR